MEKRLGMLLVTGYFKNNTFVPEKDISIPDGTKAVVSVEDKAPYVLQPGPKGVRPEVCGSPLDTKKPERQLVVFEEFLAELDKDDEVLPPEFDEIITQGINLEEVNFS
jgi:hypothetical protein